MITEFLYNPDSVIIYLKNSVEPIFSFAIFTWFFFFFSFLDRGARTKQTLNRKNSISKHALANIEEMPLGTENWKSKPRDRPEDWVTPVGAIGGPGSVTHYDLDTSRGAWVRSGSEPPQQEVRKMWCEDKKKTKRLLLCILPLIFSKLSSLSHKIYCLKWIRTS